MFNNINLGPMLLKEIPKPFNDANYVYEVKFDGIRALIHVSKDSIKIVSRNHKDITKFYPELAELKKIVHNKEVILDGEIIALDKGKPSFQKLQKRSHTKNITVNLQKEIPIYFMAFDILYENKDLTNLPLIKRKDILARYEDTDLFIKTKIYLEGKKLFQQIKKFNLEGIVAKEKNSKYYFDQRVDYWLKIKNIKDADFFIAGYVFNQEKYSLLLGEYRNNNFYYVGKVSVTKDNAILKKVLKLKKAKNKFVNYQEDANYVEIKEKVLISFLERTEEGILRHPALKK